MGEGDGSRDGAADHSSADVGDGDGDDGDGDGDGGDGDGDDGGDGDDDGERASDGGDGDGDDGDATVTVTVTRATTLWCEEKAWFWRASAGRTPGILRTAVSLARRARPGVATSTPTRWTAAKKKK